MERLTVHYNYKKVRDLSFPKRRSSGGKYLINRERRKPLYQQFELDLKTYDWLDAWTKVVWDFSQPTFYLVVSSFLLILLFVFFFLFLSFFLSFNPQFFSFGWFSFMFIHFFISINLPFCYSLTFCFTFLFSRIFSFFLFFFFCCLLQLLSFLHNVFFFLYFY